ncbi:MAG: ATP synthase F0 subunit B [Vicinamibacteria bacterium]
MISVDATALVIMALVFALVLVLKSLFFEPLARTMETRKERVDRAARAWDDAQKTIRAAAAEVTGAVTAARNEGYGLLDRARTEALAKARVELDSSREDAQNQLNEAKRELAEASARAVGELEGQADALAGSLASRILGRDVA